MLIRASAAVIGFAFAATWATNGFYVAMLCLLCALAFAITAPHLTGRKSTSQRPSHTGRTKRPNRGKRPTHPSPRTHENDPPSLESVDDLPLAHTEGYGW
jgi:hypothetical protein